MICGAASGGLNSKVKITDEILGMPDMTDGTTCRARALQYSSHVYITITLTKATEKTIIHDLSEGNWHGFAII